MSTERRTSLRLNVTPEKVQAKLRVGKQTFTARMLNESMNGFALLLDIPERHFEEQKFQKEEDCLLFGEIATLIIEKSGYEIQIVSTVPFDEPLGPKLAAGSYRVRVGVRIIREIPEREIVGHPTTQRILLAAAIILALSFSLVGFFYRSDLSQFDWSQISATELNWNSIQTKLSQAFRDQGQASQLQNELGYIAPDSKIMEQLSTQLQNHHLKDRLLLVNILRDRRALAWLDLQEDQAIVIRQLAIESETDIKQLWLELQTEKEKFGAEFLEYFRQLEIKILSNMTPQQAEKWIGYLAAR